MTTWTLSNIMWLINFCTTFKFNTGESGAEIRFGTELVAIDQNGTELQLQAR